MIENVQIINKNGDGMFTEGIAYIQLASTGKKYLFYTLNEKVDNDLTKIYIAETADTAGTANPIADSEWDDLRKKMVKINHKEEVLDINYLSMNNVVFYVGEPKKLAITTVAKQAFKEAQMSHTISTNQSEIPVISGSNTSFFNEQVVEEQSVVENSQPVEQASIFSNPPQPIVTETSVPTSVIEQPVVERTVAIEQPAIQESVVQEPVVSQVQEVAMEQPIQSIQTPIVAQPVIEQPVIEQPAVVEQQIIQESVVQEPVLPESSVATIIQSVPIVQEQNSTISSNNDLSEPLITDEEALKAISIIQEYIDQER